MWTLLEGDFREHISSAPPPDCIYYDMYSKKTNDWLWSFRLFERIIKQCGTKKTRLITYTVSTQARSALLAAGFFVGYGVGAGPKERTTIAFNGEDAVDADIHLLGKEWLGKFDRSTARTSKEISDEERIEIELKVRSHKQFSV
jgi:queuine tRNA-ribosyltransferase